MSILLSLQEGHDSEESAVEEVREGRAWAAVIIRQNFTVDLFNRINDQSIINGSSVELYVDKTSALCLESCNV